MTQIETSVGFVRICRPLTEDRRVTGRIRRQDGAKFRLHVVLVDDAGENAMIIK